MATYSEINTVSWCSEIFLLDFTPLSQKHLKIKKWRNYQEIPEPADITYCHSENVALTEQIHKIQEQHYKYFKKKIDSTLKLTIKPLLINDHPEKRHSFNPWQCWEVFKTRTRCNFLSTLLKQSPSNQDLKRY